MIIYLGHTLPYGSSGLPAQYLELEICIRYNLRLYGLASDGVYHAKDITIFPVSSYLTFSPLQICICGIFSVALSLEFPLLGVIQHHSSGSPDFPLHIFKYTAIIRPSIWQHYICLSFSLQFFQKEKFWHCL